MSCLEERFEKFLEFSMDDKFSRMMKKASDDELIDLYNAYAPMFWTKHNNMRYKIMGSMAIYVIGMEFKRRYPDRSRVQEWDFGLSSSQVNISDIVRGGK